MKLLILMSMMIFSFGAFAETGEDVPSEVASAASEGAFNCGEVDSDGNPIVRPGATGSAVEGAN